MQARAGQWSLNNVGAPERAVRGRLVEARQRYTRVATACSQQSTHRAEGNGSGSQTDKAAVARMLMYSIRVFVTELVKDCLHIRGVLGSNKLADGALEPGE